MKSYVTQAFTNFKECLQVYDELYAFETFLSKYRPNNILEIGSYMGATFWLMCQYSTGYKVSIDLCPPEWHEERQRFKLFSDGVILIDTASQLPVTVNRVIEQTQNSKFDLIFIDGEHGFDKVMEDFNIYSKFLSNRGVVVFHDIHPNHKFKDTYGVRQVWDGLIGQKMEIISNGKHPNMKLGQPSNCGGIGIWKPFNYLN
jgi:predicted O-methyltransferase YrrM